MCKISKKENLTLVPLNSLIVLVHISIWIKPFFIFVKKFKILTDKIMINENHDLTYS
jgi:hypothetical protein